MSNTILTTMRFLLQTMSCEPLEIIDDITNVRYLRDNDNAIIGLEMISSVGPQYNIALLGADDVPDTFCACDVAKQLMRSVADYCMNNDPSLITHYHGVEQRFVLTLSNQIVIAYPSDYVPLIAAMSEK